MAMATEQEYGSRVKAARKAAGLTQRDLAVRVGCDFTSISHMEHGRFLPSTTLAFALSDTLHADLIPDSEVARLRAECVELRAIADAAWRVMQIPTVPVMPNGDVAPNHPDVSKLVDLLFAYRGRARKAEATV